MYCILTKLCPFLSHQIYIQSKIRQYVVSALKHPILMEEFLQTLLKCLTQNVHVQDLCYLCAGLRSRSHLKVKIDLEMFINFNMYTQHLF